AAFASNLVGYDFISGTYSLGGGGNTVTLSVDAELNRTAYEALGDYKGAVMVCNYKTGEILCDVSKPAYDPYYPPEDIDSEQYEGAYINRGLSAQYTPGSIFKLVTLTAAIENIDDLFSRTFYCDGGVEIGDDYITCTGTHGEQNIEEALANSCNCVFGQLAVELGPETLAGYAKRLGLTDVSFVSGIQTAAGNFDMAPAGSADLAWSGIGQYTDTVVPVEMLRLLCAIANDGDAVELTMLKKGGVKLLADAKTQKLMSHSTAQRIGEMMSYNVTYTYGEDNFPGLELHAKSGTAELGEGQDSHAWFVGYIDNADHPLAFVVIAENGGWGSSTAGRIANEVLQAAIER
ncbi:MAG: penicillin-binding protein, partial [Oscillospiraceae bacterium]|nr:penicillin-binding protein [Oscillospiraceae bacterium]